MAESTLYSENHQSNFPKYPHITKLTKPANSHQGSTMANVVSLDSSPTSNHTFIRSYQACISCRKRFDEIFDSTNSSRKIKCDLGDPSRPESPPCRRCRREHKECKFQDLRTKKGGTSKPSDDVRSAKRIKDETESYQSTGLIAPETRLSVDPLCDLFSSTATTANHLGHPLASESATADRILHKEVHNAKEALNLLYEAAAETTSSGGEGQREAHTSLETNDQTRVDANTRAWQQFWCVKSGWITDTEARNYIDLYPRYFLYALITIAFSRVSTLWLL